MPEAIKTQVLVVEDDRVFANLMLFWLEHNGMLCSYAQNGKEGLQISQKKHFDLIISDLNMPQMNGIELVGELRKLPEYKNTPIIVISSEEREDSLIQILNEGADDFIHKPIAEKVFLSKVKVNLKKADLKKIIYKKNQTQNVNFEEGEILYCMSQNGNSPNLLPDDIRIRSVFSQSEMFRCLEDNLVWLLLIDQDAEWVNGIIEKIIKSVDGKLPILLLKNDDDDTSVSQTDCYLLKSSSEKYIVDQLRFIVEREKSLKSKYVNALQAATESTAFSFSRITEKQYKNFNISILHEPFAKMPGGDFYEVFSYDDRYKLIFFGDIMGKAWGAWFFVPAYIAYIRSTLKFMSYRNIKKTIESPGRILEILNKYLSQDMRFSDVFTTLTIVVVDIETNTLRIAGAGAIDPIHYTAENNEISLVNLQGMLMGINEDTKYSKVEIPFNKGDRLLFYTDGYSEAENTDTNRMVGSQGILNIFSEFAKASSLAALDLDNELISKCNIDQFMDDRSLLLISMR